VFSVVKASSVTSSQVTDFSASRFAQAIHHNDVDLTSRVTKVGLDVLLGKDGHKESIGSSKACEKVQKAPEEKCSGNLTIYFHYPNESMI
jgi:hypothetical protein